MYLKEHLIHMLSTLEGINKVGMIFEMDLYYLIFVIQALVKFD